MKHYDFCVALKEQHKAIQDKPLGSVPFSLSYIPWILNKVSQTYVKHHKMYEFNELLSVAFSASLEAEKTYNPDVARFTSYARLPIEGALNTYVRGSSKSQITLQKKVQTFIEDYYNTNKMYPSESIIIQGLNITKDVFDDLVYSGFELTYIEDEDTVLHDGIAVDKLLEFEDCIKALDYIDVDYKGILRMKLIDDYHFSTISKILGMTKSTTQRFYDTALNELREEITRRGFTKEDLECL